MPRHVWSVLCAKTSVDSQTNNLSLFEVLEQVTVLGGAPVDRKIAIPMQLELASSWTRSDRAVGETATMRFRLIMPNGIVENGPQTQVNMLLHERQRVLIKMNALPIHGQGQYEFLVEVLTPDNKWEECARVPLAVFIAAAGEGVPGAATGDSVPRGGT